jgi:hypothetical protein
LKAELIFIADITAEIKMTVISNFQTDTPKPSVVTDCNAYAPITILG